MKLPWQIVEPLDARVFAEVRLATIFDCCKWDPQVEDVCTLSPLPLVLTKEAWRELVSLAEKLAQETVAAELAILQKPHLLKQLGLSWRLRRRLSDPEVASRHARHTRLIRFDFHFTTEGWRISEANTDVPGGFNEASGFTKLIARHYGRTTTPGDPVEKMTEAISDAAGKSAAIGLVHATSFADDRQVMVFLGRRLQAAGHKTLLMAPDHLFWENGRAYAVFNSAKERVDFLVRFFPAEWLPSLPRRCGWWNLLGGAETPLCNPAAAIISQSKRFPLVWDELSGRLPTWEAMLPKTFSLRDATAQGLGPESLVFKPAFGRVGDMIKIHGVTSDKEAGKIDHAIRRHPKMWIAQQRFEAVPMSTPSGDVYPCIGVYTLNSKVIGAYGRVAQRPLIDHRAQDAAVLIAEDVFSPLSKQPPQDETIRTLQTVGA